MSRGQLSESGKQLQEEELRIRNEEEKIEDFGRHLYNILRKHCLDYQDRSYEYYIKHMEISDETLEALNSLCSASILQKTSSEESEYLLSKVFLSMGRKLVKDKKLQHWNNIPAYGTFIRDSCGLIPDMMEDKFDWWEIHQQIYDCKPVFSRMDKDAPKQIEIFCNYRVHLPEDLWKSPSVFIESCKTVKGRKRADCSPIKTIRELLWIPVDYTRVKECGDVVFKRVDFSEVHHSQYEIEETQKLIQLLGSLGDDRYNVQTLLGRVCDKGNVYLLYEKIPDSINLADWWAGRKKSPFPDQRVRSPPDEVKAYFDLKSFLSDEDYDVASRDTVIRYSPSGEFRLIVTNLTSKM